MRLPRTGAVVDTLRLVSGLTLFLFALTHFLNHALGLWSLDAMQAAQRWRLAVTRSPPGALLLGSALIVHLALALWRIARLRTWRLPRAAYWQLITRRADRGAGDRAFLRGRRRPARGGRGDELSRRARPVVAGEGAQPDLAAVAGVDA